VQLLAENGYLEGPAEKRLRTLARPRNAVVHGDPSTSIMREQVGDVLTQIKLVEAKLDKESAA
jgi:hypothetical protein